MPGQAQYLDLENAVKLLRNYVPADVDQAAWHSGTLQEDVISKVPDQDFHQLLELRDKIVPEVCDKAESLARAATGSQRQLARQLKEKVDGLENPIEAAITFTQHLSMATDELLKGMKQNARFEEEHEAESENDERVANSFYDGEAYNTITAEGGSFADLRDAVDGVVQMLGQFDQKKLGQTGFRFKF